MRLHERIPLLLVVLAALSVSCRGPKVPVGIEEGGGARGGGGFSAAAVLPDDPVQIERLFRAYPPDSGVVPVYLRVTNRDTSAVVLHTPGRLPVGERFRSIVLESGDGPVDPIHPLEVAMRLSGVRTEPGYAKMGRWHVVGGMLLPPLGVYYIFKWGEYALDYRPLLRNSFFPAGRGGDFDPVVIEPGETAAGFVYFPLGPGENPYHTRYESPEGERGEPIAVRAVRPGGGLRLSVRPATVPREGMELEPAAPGFEATGIRRIRAEREDCAAPSPDLFLLGRDRDAGEDLDLWIGDEAGLARTRSLDGFVRIEHINNRTGRIADASACGRFAVCAVNFKRRARLYSVDLGGATPSLAADLRLERNVLRVFALPDGAYVVTDDGFCGVYRYDDLARARYGRLGTSVGDAMIVGDRLYTVGGGAIDEFDCAGGRCEKTGRGGVASAGGIGEIARIGASVLAVHRGRGALGDTLVLYDTESMAETFRLVLTGGVEALDVRGNIFSAQIEGGVLMRFEARGRGEPALIDAGWLPEPAAALLTSAEGGIARSRDGRLLTFTYDRIRPAPPAGRDTMPEIPVRIGSPAGGDR